MAVKERDDAAKVLDEARASLGEVEAKLSEARHLLVSTASGTGKTYAFAELAAQLNIPAAAVETFAETVTELLGEREPDLAMVRRAALIAASGQVWENELGPLLSSAQVRELWGDISRQRVSELLKDRRLIGLQDSSGRLRFPGFQFKDGRPLEPLVHAYWTVADAALSDWTAASWCVAPDDALDGESPAGWALAGGDADRLAAVARQDAARLAR
jgi:hypothetical protein